MSFDIFQSSSLSYREGILPTCSVEWQFHWNILKPVQVFYKKPVLEILVNFQVSTCGRIIFY